MASVQATQKMASDRERIEQKRFEEALAEMGFTIDDNPMRFSLCPLQVAANAEAHASARSEAEGQ